MQSNTYEMLRYLSIGLFAVGLLGPPIAIILFRLKGSFQAAVTLATLCLAVLALGIGFATLLEVYQKSWTFQPFLAVPFCVSLFLFLLPVVEKTLLRKLAKREHQIPSRSAWAGPLFALLFPIPCYLLIGLIIVLTKNSEVPQRLAFASLTLVQAYILVRLYPYSWVVLKDRPNAMRWWCAFVASIQFPLVLVGLFPLWPLYFSFKYAGHSFPWGIALLSCVLLPIGLFLYVLKRDHEQRDTRQPEGAPA